MSDNPATRNSALTAPFRQALAFANRHWRGGVIGIPYFWLLLFFAIPFLIVLKISLADPVFAQPPYTPLFNWADDAKSFINITFDNFKLIAQDRLYILTYLNSVKLAATSTLLCLLLGYPMAYYIARAQGSRRNILLLLVILPFWTSFLLRVYAWMGMLNQNGIINSFLLWTGIVDEPVQLLYTNTAVFIGIVYSYLPFMILPLYANLERLDESLLEAAYDLGAKPWQVFRDVTLPLSWSGIAAGSLLVFVPAMGEFVIPTLLGSQTTLMIGRVLYDEFFFNRDWPLASAVAIVLLAILVVPIMLFQHFQSKGEGAV